MDESYRIWFSFPWYTIYTLNIDNVADAANRAFDLPRELRTFSALSDSKPPVESAELPVVHLNGRLGDLPGVTFSMRQYGERLGGPDPWYELLIRDLRVRPVLYVGTSLEEPPLWTYIEARGEKPEGGERRPGSYLVTPSLTRAREIALTGYNITWVEGTANDFLANELASLIEASEEGQAAVARRLGADYGGRPLLPLLEIVDDKEDDARELLRGRHPRWSDLTEGYAFERECDLELAKRVQDEEPQLVVITGTAGTGKSLSGMRLVLDAAARGQRVMVLNELTGARIHEIRRAVADSDIDIVFIDNVGRFGESAADLLNDFMRDSPDLRIVATIRSGQLENYGPLWIEGTKALEYVIPRLEPSDVDGLLDALDRANRLGVLKGKTRVLQRRAFDKQFDNQLLVAMIEVTQDVRFSEKVETECQEMTGSSPGVYAAAVLATTLGTPLTDNELVTASGVDNPAEAIQAIDRLVARHLLIRTGSGRLSVRHLVIAETAIRYYREIGILQPIVTSLTYALAASSRPGDLRSTPSGRLLMRLLNHDRLVRLLYRRVSPEADRAAVRGVYDKVEGILDADYHYWLQRGSFETEEGNLESAKLFLEQARAMMPSDWLVRTEWSYMTLKRASRNPNDPTAPESVEAAFEELEEVIRARGKRDYQPYHIYGSQGLSWVRRGPLGEEDRRRLLEQLRRVVGQGRDRHPGRDELQTLKTGLDREYMMMAVDTGKPDESEKDSGPLGML